MQALFNMGEMLRGGSGGRARGSRIHAPARQGVERNRTEAFRCFHASAMVPPSPSPFPATLTCPQRGHFKAMYMLGQSYWFGWGTERR